jgi:hypothetical protein
MDCSSYFIGPFYARVVAEIGTAQRESRIELPPSAGIGPFLEDIMGKLTTEARKKLPKSAFALPGGRYPVEDKAHARDAKARASQGYNSGHLTSAEKAKVDRKADAVLAKKGK